MPLTGGDRAETARGRNRLAVCVQPPTCDLARLTYGAGVIVAGDDSAERPRRRGGLAVVVAALAGDLARLEQGAGVRFAGCDRDGARAAGGRHADEMFAGRIRLAVLVVTPAVDLAVSRQCAGVIPAGRDGHGRVGLLRRCGRFADDGERGDSQQKQRPCHACEGGSADEREG